MQVSVTLSQQSTHCNGKCYKYWVIRWFGSDGKRRSKHLGSTSELSKRQAEKRRRAKEAELQESPGRRDVSRSPELGTFLQRYFADRKIELASGTLELHERTGRYLISFFGEHRRLETISRSEARAFKTALASGELAHVNKQRRRKNLEATTVDQHVRHARKMFNHALDDDLITFNPFDRIGQTEPVEKDWHYVDEGEFAKLMAAAKPAWRLLFGLARWAGLRLEEALELPWRKIDWKKRRLTIISRDRSASEGSFMVKDKDARAVPISPELYQLLLAHKQEDGLVVPAGGVVYSNHWRDFEVIRKRAGVAKYAKPVHCLRKSCITDWATHFPAHVVKEWAGHADIRTTLKFYLKVSELEYDKAAGLEAARAGLKPTEADYDRAATVPVTNGNVDQDKGPDGKKLMPSAGQEKDDLRPGNVKGPEPAILPISAALTQNLAQNAVSEPSSRRKSKAGDGIRTHDVQLGKPGLPSRQEAKRLFQPHNLHQTPPSGKLSQPEAFRRSRARYKQGKTVRTVLKYPQILTRDLHLAIGDGSRGFSQHCRSFGGRRAAAGFLGAYDGQHARQTAQRPAVRGQDDAA